MIQHEVFYKLIVLSNETRIPFLPLIEIQDMFKETREALKKIKDEKERNLNKSFQMELIKNITMLYLLEQKQNG